MDINKRELANLLERAFAKWSGANEEEHKNIKEIYPTDEEFLELAEKVLIDIAEIKGKWVI